MEFSTLAESFNKMESTRKRLELTQFLEDHKIREKHYYASNKILNGSGLEYFIETILDNWESN